MSSSDSSKTNEPSANEETTTPHRPTVILVIGMAGSGKTTFIQRLNSHFHTTSKNGYIINLDPAVKQVPYGANIDIRDTVKYKNVMKQYNLGPNGGILTSCNLFATRFDQVMKLLEKPRTPPLDYIVVDTPGQIEIFTWSASGTIITELLASGFPTVVAYVADTPRCAHPQVFMSNMLQACSILYKTRLPLLLVLNKIDVTRHEFAKAWMEDFDVYQEALDAVSDSSVARNSSGYASSLSRSLALVLEGFYDGLHVCGVSAVTGEGIENFLNEVEEGAKEYHKSYVPELQKLQEERQAKERKRQERDMA
eukprot:CAMPEP_0175079380 /NCGR_PEP_ID=MMETSP0052_2-20121109/24785_1 /TAXON_ID=51329 ORGANISM="Polytomella parva, Strain SAG 63-3" /NCGR_SAMPLE_ID=MMETSP0052_2 /ASSEMBLY_ACC=CAM_ASM_000194 /LENGTH=308 /DNA_ID=CAMNT_0016349693 /DNA_START=114 /DNA_END=1037 /DNA_ORIENTATION=+